MQLPNAENHLQDLKKENTNSEWMDLKTAAAYINVSFKTLKSFQPMGLEIAEIGRLRRVSKTALDEFMRQNSF